MFVIASLSDKYYNIVVGMKEKGLKQYDIEVRLLTKEDLLNCESDELLKDIDILIAFQLTANQFHKMDKLKAIIVPMTGLDGFEEEILKSGKVQILNIHSTAPYIAERGLALLMTLAGRIHSYTEALRMNLWRRIGEDGCWHSLRYKRIGIYGFGYIGQEFLELIRPYQPEIYIIDRDKPYSEFCQRASIHCVKDLEALASESEILFIAVPLNSETEGSIDSKILSLMKDGFIINVARGKIVDQYALYDALKNGIIGGYGSDVWYNYPKRNDELMNPADVDLGEFENVVMTPHNAWNMDHKKGLVEKEVKEYIMDMVASLLMI